MRPPHALPGLTRRGALLGLASAFSLGRAALAFGAAATERRLVVVILRGALDGMAAVVPYGDPDARALRAPLLPKPPGQPDGMHDLGGFFGLHPALTGLHGLYAVGDLLVVHAVAGSDRSRSHFIAQDVLEMGSLGHDIASGWLNRAAGLVKPPAEAEPALAVGPSMPLLLRGPTPVGTWMPQGAQHPPPDFYAQLAALHEPDPLTGPAIANAMRERGFNAAVMAADPAPPGTAFPALCAAAGRLLAAPDGPRVAALEIGGWDTHAQQAGRLPGTLRQLDDGLVALKAGLAAAWRQTAVLVVTEFGRTARVNGTGGTDHGTGTVAFVLGGAVAGGRVAGTWPGLGEGKLFEKRDLQPTTEIRSVAKGLLAAHLGLDGAALAKVFPDSLVASPMHGLLRA